MKNGTSDPIAIYEESPTPMLVWDSSALRFLHANAAACLFYGYALEEFKALAPAALYPAAGRAYIETFFENEESDRIDKFTTLHVTAAGDARDVLLSTCSVTWAGRPAQLITVRGAADETLAGPEARYRGIFDDNVTPMFVCDSRSGLFVDANAAACNYYGYSREAFLTKGAYNWYPPAQHSTLRAAFAEYSSRAPASMHRTHLKADGTSTDVLVSTVPIPWNESIAILVTVQDLSERNAALAAIKSSNDVFRRAQRIGKFGDWSLDLRTREMSWSDGLFALLGRPRERGIPGGRKPHRVFYTSDNFARLEEMERRTLAGVECDGEDFEIIRQDESILWIRQDMAAEFNAQGVAIRLMGTLHDISAHKDVEAKLEAQARIDALTGLPNRKAASEALNLAIVAAKRTNLAPAVLFIDLDDFKRINDTLGHSAGDDLLIQVSKRVRSALHPYDFVARMGDDEFAVILSDLADRDAVSAIVDKIQQRIAEPIELAGRQQVVVTASIGIAFYPEDGTTAEALIMNSDTAMYHGKCEEHAGRRFFSSEMHAAAEVKLQLDIALRFGIETSAFTLFYQPIVATAGGVVGCEALVRWPQADGTMLAPSDFIPYAEESGLIVPLGKWVLATACAKAAEWNAGSDARLRMSVNVSAKQIADPGFVKSIFDILANTGLAPDLLELEFTETVVARSPEQSCEVARQLRSAGIRISLDDFGTGYNSLVNLRMLEIDTLKLDKCFVDEIGESTIDRAIAAAVISAARTLGATPLAEGVETLSQCAILAALGVDEMQGYLYAKPMPASDMEEFMRRERHAAFELHPMVAA
jgi:diguanylate cyclase (GGDEF)-like protein/PAS domain S-box-containing protein